MPTNNLPLYNFIALLIDKLDMCDDKFFLNSVIPTFTFFIIIPPVIPENKNDNIAQPYP